MTTLEDRPNSALLVIDVQNRVVAEGHERDRIVSNIASLVDTAREQGIAVIWVQHADDQLESGTADWEIVPELSPRETEPVIEKSYGDAFEDTQLESVLADLSVGHLVITGAQTDACIRASLHGGFVRGYDVTLVSDAHTTQDLSEWGAPSPDQVIRHTNLYWAYHSAPGRQGVVENTADISFKRPG
jgi:nicotinamidase-related amidase